MAKRVKIPGRLESAETGNIVTGADAIMDDEKGKTQVTINSEVDAAITSLAQDKQDALTFDNVPTEGSPNPVTSAGVYSAYKVLSDAIEAILLLIPSAASALNKLVDMQTMNSSIATATASFKGTYNLVSDLHLGVDATHEQIGAALDALSLGADNNDYAFVQVPESDTSEDIKVTQRYKFNGTTWAYEYDLNNSGFTAEQWAAINSGVTSLLVSKLSDLPTNAELTILLAGKQDNLTFDNVPTAGSPNPVKSGGVYARNNEIVALINALDAAKQNVLTFDNAPVAGSSNPVKSGGVYTAISAVQAAIVALDAAKQNVLTFDSTPTLGSTNPVTSSGIKTELNRIDGNITTLNDLYEALTQSALVIVQPTDTWPVASPATSTIYRVVDRENTPPQYYSDYMWNGSAMVLMATYDNAIDPRPKKASQNLVTSGGVFDNMGALDVSELNATENPHTLAQYTDLSAALAAVPTNYQKGGMSIKFVQSSDNKYVQYRLMSDTFKTSIANWQGVDVADISPYVELMPGFSEEHTLVAKNIELLEISGQGQHFNLIVGTLTKSKDKIRFIIRDADNPDDLTNKLVNIKFSSNTTSWTTESGVKGKIVIAQSYYDDLISGTVQGVNDFTADARIRLKSRCFLFDAERIANAEQDIANVEQDIANGKVADISPYVELMPGFSEEHTLVAKNIELLEISGQGQHFNLIVGTLTLTKSNDRIQLIIRDADNPDDSTNRIVNIKFSSNTYSWVTESGVKGKIVITQSYYDDLISGAVQGVNDFTADARIRLKSRCFLFDGAEHIVCWGDSITAGSASANYPLFLQELLGNDAIVENLGVGSTLLQDISARQGGVPALLKTPVVIPSNTEPFSMAVDNVYNAYQTSTFKLASRFHLDISEKAYNPVMIDGVEMNFTFSVVDDDIVQMQINRIEEGNSFTVKAGTPIYPHASGKYSDYFAIFFMGTNNTSPNSVDLTTYTETIIKYHDDCIALLKNKKYLILGLFNISEKMRRRGSSETPTDEELLLQYESYEFQMRQKYGLRFIPLRSILASQKALDDAVSLGYISQAQKEENATIDAEWIAKGCLPKTFMVYSSTDYVHPNRIGHEMIAYYVSLYYKKLSNIPL